MTVSTGYSRKQIALHWIIAGLVVFQYVAHEGIVAVMEAFEKGVDPSTQEFILSRMHVILGTLVLVLAIWRLMIRLKHGAPAAPEGEAPILVMVSKVTHVVLYAMIFMMPISGIMTWFVSAETFGAGHSIGRFIMLGTIVLHTLGALYHWIVLKSGVMQRMFKAK